MPLNITYSEKAIFIKYSRGSYMDSAKIKTQLKAIELKKSASEHIVLDLMSLSNIASSELAMIAKLRNIAIAGRRRLFVALHTNVKAMLEGTELAKLEGLHLYDL